jgi:methionyl-tRNA formyltransferase
MKKVAFLNCIESGHELLTHLLKNGTKIDYIISLTPTQARDFNVSGYKDFSDISQQYNIPIYYPKKYNLSSKQDLEFFTQQNFDLMMVFGWQRLVFMKFDLNEWDTCHTSYHKVQICLRKMLLKNLDLILEGKVTPTKQDHSKATYYPKRTPKDGIIDWKKTTKEVYNLVRAVTKPYPGAFTPKKQVMIWKSQPFDSKISYPSAHPGEVIEVFNDKSFVIKTTDGSLYVTEYDSKKLIKIGDKL